MKRKLLLIILTAIALLTAGCSAADVTTAVPGSSGSEAGTSTAAEAAPAGLVVLFTGDTNGTVTGGLGYQTLADIRQTLEGTGAEVILADCGGALRGSIETSLSDGESAVRLMNAAGYDIATFGEGDFEYGLGRLEELIGIADFTYVCCNFVDVNGESLLAPYRMYDLGGYKTAVIGVTSPDAAARSGLAGSEGGTVYGFCEEAGGEALYACVQKAADQAREAGADYVLLLSHLGNGGSADCWSSRSLISATDGIDAVMDSGSQTPVQSETVANRSGSPVLLTAVGSGLEDVGAIQITGEGALRGYLVNSSTLDDFSAVPLMTCTDMQQAIQAVNDEISVKASEVIAHSDCALVTHTDSVKDSDGNPIRIIRSQETNLGDLIADAVRYVSGADIGVINGASIESALAAGDITTADILSVLPQAQDIVVIEATGRQILDAIEYSTSYLPSASTSFLQVSGLSYSVDLNNSSTVVTDDDGGFAEISGARRVLSCMAGSDDIEKDKTYTIAGPAYILADGGEGYTMFAGSSVISRTGMTDTQMLLKYLTENLSGSIPDRYAEVYGLGRVRMVKKAILSESAIEKAIAYARKAKENRPSNWQHYCAKFCNDCYQYGAKIKVERQPTARELGDHLITHTGMHPPAGAFVFWYKAEDKYGHPGHVALSLGDGMIIHPFPDLVITSIDYPGEHGYIYRGWGAPVKDTIFEEELYY